MTENIFLFVPNIIGYSRVFLLVVSLWFMPYDPVKTTYCYVLSQLLDAVDGHAARYFNQCTRLGAMLDQLTDRCSTLCLLMMLSHFFPKYIMLFQLSSAIDVASHWLHLHSSDIRGGVHYKKIQVTNVATQILYYYYTSRPFLFFMCAANELFYCTLYWYHFGTGPLLPVFKIGLWPLLAAITFPFSFLKSIISLFHLYEAANAVVRVDEKERRLAKLAKTE